MKSYGSSKKTPKTQKPKKHQTIGVHQDAQKLTPLRPIPRSKLYF
ncbi:hypothetical protein AO366_1446 [Moraxella catarrhalis]|nr:hypothetical protein AO366_1446 [Moraxella catarrhalis]